MSKPQTIEQAIMEYFELDLVPESLLQAIETIILDNVIGSTDVNARKYQAIALTKALRGEE